MGRRYYGKKRGDKMILIREIEVYTPEYIGIKDVLVTGNKIYRIGEEIEIDKNLLEGMIDGRGKKLVPGFIDPHVHVCGGGGEGGFKTRTPEIGLTDIIKAGVTTVIGVLGTDGTTRTMSNLVAKTKGLREEGVSAYCLTGSYEVPVRTLTGSIVDDLVLIEEIIGCGEISIADHRSSHPDLNAFRKVASDTRLGGILSGKAGKINVHMGDSRKTLRDLREVIENSEVPIKQFLPTHMNRNPYLFEDCVNYVKDGGYADFTTSTTPEFLADGEVKCSLAMKRILEECGNLNNITLSSDGQGSLPEFDSEGRLVRLKIGSCETLYPAVRDAVVEEGIALNEAIKTITSNTADIYKLNKGYIAEGRDADLVVLDENLEIDSVIAMGRVMIYEREQLVKGTFE